MAFTVKCDTRSLKSLIKRVQGFDGTSLKAGFFEDAVYGPENDNLPVATVAWWNEHGTYHNPTRPFLLPAFEDRMNQMFYIRSMEGIFTNLIDNGRMVKAKLKSLGQDIQGIIEVNIDDFPGRNSEWWAAIKGFNDPLRYTSKMLNSVTFRVVR